MASECPEPASVRPAGTTAGVLDGVEAFPTKGSSNLASIHLVAQPPFGLPLLPDRGHPAAFVFILWP